MKNYKKEYHELEQAYLKLVGRFSKLRDEMRTPDKTNGNSVYFPGLADPTITAYPERGNGSSAYCAECRNGVMIERAPYSGEPNSYKCVLDCECYNFCRK